MKKLLIFAASFAFIISCNKKEVNDTNEQVASEMQLIDVAYGTDPAQKMDIYLPAERNVDTRIIILIHGGAWSSGDKSDFKPLVTLLQQKMKGYAIANINYRLATISNHHFPSQEQDLKKAIDFLLQKNADYKISKDLILLGASAGGHMAMLQAYKYDQPKIKTVIDFFGPTDMKELHKDAVPGSFGQQAIEVLVGGAPTSNPSAYQQSSPIYFVTSTSPPTLIFHGEKDEIVKVSQSIALKNKLESNGVTHQLILYPNLGHTVWPEQVMNDAFEKIKQFIQMHVR